MPTIIGKKIKTRHSEDQVSGRLKYTGDFKIAGMLTAAIVRSKYAFAKILHIDVSKAKRQSGVIAVLTGHDIPLKRFGIFLKDQYMLAKEMVLYWGEPIALIAAVDEDTAELAKELIEIDYEPLPPIFDPVISKKSESTPLHPDLDKYGASWPAIREGNICSKTIIHRGGLTSGFSNSDYVFENTFKTHCVHQCPMETQVAIAVKDVNQRLQVKIPTQHAFGSQQLIAEVLQVPAAKINVTALPAGGSFGAKIENIAAFYASILAWYIEKPIKLKFSREEEFLTSTPRHPAIIKHKTGVKKDGSLIAWQSELIFDTGAYAWAGPAVTGVATMFAAGPYRIPNFELVGHCVYTNKAPNGAFRGYGNPQAAFAHESQIDIIAKDLGIDPIEMRLRNVVKDGDKFTLGYPYRGVTLEKTLIKAASESQWDLKKKAKSPGMGVACIQHVTGGLPSAISLKGNSDGTIELMSGMPEIGTGVSTIAPQIVSHELSIPIERIHFSHTVNTDSAPYEYGLGISRSCFNIGNAAIIVSAKFKDKIITMGSDLLQVDAKYLKIRNGSVHDGRKGKGAKISFKQVFQKAHDANYGPILVEGTYAYPLIKPDPDTVEGMPLPGFPQFTFGTQIAELEVDEETGQINILRITAVHDVGKAINPSTVEGQIYGGVVQGIGFALTESLCFDKGIPVNASLLDYKLLGVEDVPEIHALMMEEPDPEGPHGAKGIGEPPIIATAPAIVNAVENAAGVRIKQLPLTAEIILHAFKKK